jgi:N-acetylmuramoyl-L-alanine amidase
MIMLIRHPRLFRTLLLILPLCAPALHAQEMPLEIHARYWESPGPEQSEEGAPRLLIVYPVKEGSPSEAKTARYAGRVEPVDAKVTLNGEELKIWPGGVFTGLQEIKDDDKDFAQSWKFEASAAGKKTTVRRTLKLKRPVPVPQAWPLSFFAAPVSPTGDFVVPDGKTLDVKLYGSPEAKAEYRIGEGAWQAMEAAGKDEKRGAEYKATLTPPVVDARGPQKVIFRLTAEHEGEKKTITKEPGLRVGMMAPGAVYAGEITQYVATYLKNPEGWDRWGNWLEGTRFPVLEVRGDRARTDFGQAGDESKGWLELIHSKIDWTSTGATGLVVLNPERPQMEASPNAEKDQPIPIMTERFGRVSNNDTNFTWTLVGMQRPLAAVFNFEPQLGGDTGVKVKLPGARDAFSGKFESQKETGTFERIRKPDEIPTIQGVSKLPWWGFGMRVDPVHGFQVELRTAPKLDKTTAEKPLTGMRIMLDAGHGGDDAGALGPSGITEADLNLVQAAWLGKYLEEMGAEVKQLRRSDVKIELDDRCKQAIAWDPDLFVSVHHNSVGFGQDPNFDSGPIVFFHYPHSEPLAKSIAKPLAEAFGSGGGKTENFRVNRNFNLCPSVLVETAYVCNAEDDYKLRKTETTRKTAKAVAEGIKAYVVGTQQK